MSSEKQISPEDLLACFFAQCETLFSFLKDEHGFWMVRGLAEYKNGRRLILPYKKQPLGPQFWCIACYEKQGITVELSYSHQDLTLESHVVINHVDRFTFVEFLEAAKRTNKSINGAQWVGNEESMVRVLRLIAQILKKNIALFTQTDPKILERALSKRSKRLYHAIHEQYKRDIKKACTRAAKAFRDKDYRKVIELYTPYEKDLGTSDLKKFQIAKRNLEIGSKAEQNGKA